MNTLNKDIFTEYGVLYKQVQSIKSIFDYSYILNTYIDNNYWADRIKNIFNVNQVDNLTDFNYSKCFSYHVDINNEGLKIGHSDFDKFLKDHGLIYRIEILISVLGPFITTHFFKYTMESGEVILKSSNKPFEDIHNIFSVKIIEFCRKFFLKMISDEDLRKTINDISLEVAGKSPSIYNIFFDDIASKFPYD